MAPCNNMDRRDTEVTNMYAADAIDQIELQVDNRPQINTIVDNHNVSDQNENNNVLMDLDDINIDINSDHIQYHQPRPHQQIEINMPINNNTITKSELFREIVNLNNEVTILNINDWNLSKLMEVLNVFILGYCIHCSPHEYSQDCIKSYLVCTNCGETDALYFVIGYYSNIVHIISRCCPNGRLFFKHRRVTFDELFCHRCDLPMFFGQMELMICEDLNL